MDTCGRHLCDRPRTRATSSRSLLCPTVAKRAQARSEDSLYAIICWSLSSWESHARLPVSCSGVLIAPCSAPLHRRPRRLCMCYTWGSFDNASVARDVRRGGWWDVGAVSM